MRDRVLLVAAMLEQRVFAADTFSSIKCTDVIEHVRSPAVAAAEMLRAIHPRGSVYVLTPNKWNFYMREPHVKLWGVQFLPRTLADGYSNMRLGVTYSTVSSLLSVRQLRAAFRVGGAGVVRLVPVEDKHLNPGSRRGQKAKLLFSRGPLAWLSRAVRPVQPVLEAVVVRAQQ